MKQILAVTMGEHYSAQQITNLKADIREQIGDLGLTILILPVGAQAHVVDIKPVPAPSPASRKVSLDAYYARYGQRVGMPHVDGRVEVPFISLDREQLSKTPPVWREIEADAGKGIDKMVLKIDASAAIELVRQHLEPGSLLLSAEAMRALRAKDSICMASLYKHGIDSSNGDGFYMDGNGRMAYDDGTSMPVTTAEPSPLSREVKHVDVAEEGTPIRYVWLTKEVCTDQQILFALSTDDSGQVPVYAIPLDQMSAAVAKGFEDAGVVRLL